MGAVREDMDDERDKHRETFCFASLCYVRDHSSTDVQSRHCPSRATTVAATTVAVSLRAGKIQAVASDVLHDNHCIGTCHHPRASVQRQLSQSVQIHCPEASEVQ